MKLPALVRNLTVSSSQVPFSPSDSWLDPFSNEMCSIPIDWGHFPVCNGCQSRATKNLLYFTFVKTVPMWDEVMIFLWQWGFHDVDDDEGAWRFKEMSQKSSDLRNIFEMVIR